jgi:hypothetical protein
MSWYSCSRSLEQYQYIGRREGVQNLQIAKQHQNSKLANGREVQRGLWPHELMCAETRVRTHLIAHIRLKVFVRRNIDAHAAVFERGGQYLVYIARHGGHNDVRLREAFLKRKGCRADDVVWVEAARVGTLGVNMYRAEIHREHARAVVCEQRSERPTDNLRPEWREARQTKRLASYAHRLSTVTVFPYARSPYGRIELYTPMFSNALTTPSGVHGKIDLTRPGGGRSPVVGSG